MKRRTFLFNSAVAGALGLLGQGAIAAGPGPLAGRVFGNGSEVLFVALHGDLSDGGNADYQHGIAERIARANSNVTAFGLVRPGYRDGAGNASPGSNNNRRDHYTRQNNALVADTIANLKAAIGARRVVALGHSGGAAQLGAIIGSHPGLIDSAILVSCPCDIARWRQMRGRGAWSKSQSPSSLVRRVPSATRVIAVTGAGDDNAFPVLAQNYIGALQKRGVPSAFIEVPGAQHSYGSALRGAAERLANQEIRR